VCVWAHQCCVCKRSELCCQHVCVRLFVSLQCGACLQKGLTVLPIRVCAFVCLASVWCLFAEGANCTAVTRVCAFVCLASVWCLFVEGADCAAIRYVCVHVFGLAPVWCLFAEGANCTAVTYVCVVCVCVFELASVWCSFAELANLQYQHMRALYVCVCACATKLV